jgi:hypothetical protein
MKESTLVGFWKFNSNRIQREDGTWFQEKLFGGSMVFSESGHTCLFVRSDQGPWGYTGSYKLANGHVSIQIEASIAEDMEGTSLERDVKVISENELLFSGKESHTGRPFEVTFFRV